jgi:uncharacterized membrane protein
MVPLHPAITHFPIALAFIIPLLVVIFALMIRGNKMAPQSWLVIIGLQLAVVVSGYVALETGENEEDQVSKVVAKNLIHEHEEAAEIFVGASVLCLLLAIAAYFIPQQLSFRLKLGLGVAGLVTCFLAYRTGEKGGELVYKYGAASVYSSSEELLPTPGQKTSESPSGPSENESLKTDDNDYGNSDEDVRSDDEFTKQED